jgi:hypothetical protein
MINKITNILNKAKALPVLNSYISSTFVKTNSKSLNYLIKSIDLILIILLISVLIYDIVSILISTIEYFFNLDLNKNIATYMVESF